MVKQGIQTILFTGVFMTLACGLFDANADEHMEHRKHGEKMGEHKMEEAREMQHVRMWADVDVLVAVLHPTEGNTANGLVKFHATDDGIHVEAHIEGLEPETEHGIHIHEFGDCSEADGTSAGGHYNPEGHEHGLPDEEMRHAGDLGNLKADKDGVAHYEITVKNISLVGPGNPIVGRGVIVHAKPDTGAQPTGEAGARLACGVIGVSRHAEE